MSDAIREAFEAWAIKRYGNTVSLDEYNEAVLGFGWDAWQAALQSRTAPAVPEELRDRLMNLLCALGHQGCDMGGGQMYNVGEWGIKEAQELHTLLSAPQPDHSPDAGKVVHWTVDNPGLADQYRCESRAVRKALGFDPDADDVSPRDLVDAIAEIKNAPAADGGEVEPVAKYAANEIRSVLTGMIQWKDGEWAEYGPERLAAVAEKLDELYTHHAQPRNELDSEDQKGMERIVEAVAKIGIDVDSGFAPYDLQQCHIDRAMEIKKSLDRLRSNGGDV